MKAANKGILAGVLVVLLFGAVIAGLAASGVLELSWGGSGPGGPGGPGPSVQPTGTQRVYVLYDQGQVSEDVTTSLTEGTNYDITYWVVRGGSMTYLGAASSGSATVVIDTATDGNYIYAAVTPHSGQSYYVDAAKTNEAPAVTGVTYQTLNNVRQFVFQLDLNAMTFNPDTNKYEYWGTYWFKAYAAPTLNSPSDITSIGTNADQVKYINWATTTTEKTSFAVVKVTVTLNTTDVTKVSVNSINIPGLGPVLLSNPDEGASSLKYTWQVSPYDLSAARYITLPAGGNNNFDWQTKVTCNLASSDVIGATLSIYGLDMNGAAVAAISDTVALTES